MLPEPQLLRMHKMENKRDYISWIKTTKIIFLALIFSTLSCSSKTTEYKIKTDKPLTQIIDLKETVLLNEPIAATYKNNLNKNDLITLTKNQANNYFGSINLLNGSTTIEYIPCSVCKQKNQVRPLDIMPYFQKGQWLLGGSDGVYELNGSALWHSSKLISPVKYFIKNDTLFLITLETDSSGDVLSIRDVMGQILHSTKLEEHGYTEGNIFTKDSKTLNISLNDDSSLATIIVSVNLGPKKNGLAEVFDSNLALIRRFDLDISRIAKPINWPMPTNQENYFVNGDLNGHNAIVKNSNDNIIFSTKITGQCSVLKYPIIENVAFKNDINHLVIVLSGGYECPISIVSIFNPEGTLVWQKEYPTISSISKNQISSGQQILLLSTDEGLVKLSY